MLLYYKIHEHEKNAYRVGINGSAYYGSMFHRNIAKVFFDAASDSDNPLHNKSIYAVSHGVNALEEFVRENIFMPFVENHSHNFESKQIIAAASGVRVWVNAMSEFFSEIPSLIRNPENNMSTIFIKPEQKLQSYYDLPNHSGRLYITGCYDALLFNPDRSEARLFEFKGYSKSDLAVPLSQSLIYSWLIWKFSGIVPSIEIIYLDEENIKPDIFDIISVKNMIISGLPKLFYTAFNIVALRRPPEIMNDKKLCTKCKFNRKCERRLTKRTGASLINVLVFFMASIMITAQLFFFSANSQETMAFKTEALTQRFSMDKKLNDAYTILKENSIITLIASTDLIAYAEYDKLGEIPYTTISSDGIASEEITIRATNYKSFKDGAMIHSQDNIMIYDLNYTLINNNDKYDATEDYWNSIDEQYRIFPAIRAEDNKHYFLIRILSPFSDTRKTLMYQALVSRNELNHNEIKTLSFHEEWF